MTAPPVYAFEYWLGRHVWGGPPVVEIRDALVVAMRTLAEAGRLDPVGAVRPLLDLGADVVLATWIGGGAVGLTLGAASFGLSLCLIRAQRRRHNR